MKTSSGTRGTQLVKLARWASGTLLAVAWASACSGSDKTVVASGDAGQAGQANLEGGGGPGSGGSSTSGPLAGAAGEAIGTGGADVGEAGASSGGATLGGANGGGGEGGQAEVDVCPNAPESSGAGCAWKAVAACNTGVTIAEWCGVGMRAAQLQLCTGAGLYTPDASYSEFALATCPADGCPVDAKHVVWRCIECCPAQ